MSELDGGGVVHLHCQIIELVFDEWKMQLK